MKTTTNGKHDPPPHDIEAEMALLGCAIVASVESPDDDALGRALELVRPGDFYLPKHNDLWTAIGACHDHHNHFDRTILQRRLTDAGVAKRIGGAEYVTDLIEGVATTATLQTHADRVAELAHRRRVEEAAEAVMRGARDGDLAKLGERIRDLSAVGEHIAEANAGPVVRRLGDVTPEAVQWLWPGRIALGKPTLIAGDPGLSKSFLTLDIASRVSTGLGFPDAPHEQREPGGVVILSAEDDVADTIVPRLMAAGADLGRIVAVESVRATGEHGERVLRPLDLSQDLRHVERAVDEVGDCKLLIVDPVSAYMGRTDSHENAAVRGLLAQLADLAARRRLAVVCVSHLNKGDGRKAAYRVTGSLGFVASARAVWTVSRDEADASRRLFLPVKNNLAGDTEGLAYSLRDAGHGVPQLHWEADPVTMTADEAMAERKPTRADEAADWLRALIGEHGPMSAEDVEAEARQAGHAWRTVARAKTEAGVVSEQQRDEDGALLGWVWRVADAR